MCISTFSPKENLQEQRSQLPGGPAQHLPCPAVWLRTVSRASVKLIADLRDVGTPDLASPPDSCPWHCAMTSAPVSLPRARLMVGSLARLLCPNHREWDKTPASWLRQHGSQEEDWLGAVRAWKWPRESTSLRSGSPSTLVNRVPLRLFDSLHRHRTPSLFAPGGLF